MSAADRGCVLVAGGAGYVGSHTCLRLAQAGFSPVVIDNLTNGHRAFVQWGPLEVGDIRDGAWLDAVFARHAPLAVLHFAGLIEVGESVRRPGSFYENNVAGSIGLVAAARRAGLDKFVFSSTCATYGAPLTPLLSESHSQNPLNPYGTTKLMVEQMLRDLDAAEGFRSIILRYFNAAGADPQGRIGERHSPETHALPLAIVAALQGGSFKIFGDDYATPDGTAVRDYIHVLDLADAHVLAVERLLSGGESDAFNLGTGHGTSVRELIAAIEKATQTRLMAELAPRRAGDAEALVADARKAERILGWKARLAIDDIVDSAVRWHRSELALQDTRI